MFTILNRLRGTDGLWSKIIGLLLALIAQIVFDNAYVSIAVGLGYIIGESFGWGEWVGTISVHQDKIKKSMTTYKEGESWGIKQIASFLIGYNEEKYNNFKVYEWINYCRVALAVRGLYWWLPTLAPLYFVGFNHYCLAIAVVLLSVGFPIACEIGYRTAKLFSFNKYGFSMNGGWEHQEVWYGLFQDIALLCLIWSIL